MQRSGAKRLLIVLFTFLGSYISSLLILPFSYWKAYAALPASKIAIDELANLLFCIILLELSFFIDRKLNKKIQWAGRPLKRLIVQVLLLLVGVLSLLIVLAVVYALLGYFGGTPSPPIGLRPGFYTLISIILWTLMISTLHTGNFLLNNWKAATVKAAEFEIKAAQHKQLAAETELQALKLQLDPHFVFNNLSVLSELILKDQEAGYNYSEQLARVYRYLLTNAKKQLIPLREELRFLDAYLFLIDNRMNGGSVFEINIAPEQLDLLIPPVTLQLLVENALKYNRTEKEDPLVVHLYVNGQDELVVSNTLLPLIREQESTGLGLQNIMARYALLGDKQPSIDPTDTTFTVKVPLFR